MDTYQTIVIGGGFFGAVLARDCARAGEQVLLIEAGETLLGRASVHNQARIHMGYHYPRSYLTACRSRLNAPRFVNEFGECVHASFRHCYAIGRSFSKVTASQFQVFCARIGAPLQRAPQSLRRQFNPALIEDVFLAEEYAFDALRLRERLVGDLDTARVTVRVRSEARTVRPATPNGLQVVSQGPEGVREDQGRRVFNCTYSRMNALLAASALPRIPLKHEVTEMIMVDPPPELRAIAVTVMCGPFFSYMPFPPARAWTLSHVRYTPHFEWMEEDTGPYRDPYQVLERTPLQSRGVEILRDAARYLPIMEACRQVGSIWEVKTVMPRSEMDDSRPILFRPHHGLPGLHCVTGGKLDNVYDMLASLNEVDAEAGIS